MITNLASRHPAHGNAPNESPTRAHLARLSCSTVVSCIFIVMWMSGCASSKPAAENISVPVAAGAKHLSGTVLVKVTPPSNTASLVPGSGIAGSIPFSPPKAYFEDNVIAHAVQTSLHGAALFSQVYDSLNEKAKPDFILDVAFGHMYVGMVFMGEGVTVDFPCTWRLLRQNDGKELVAHTVQAHGAGNSLSSKAASQKAFERALRDAISKGIPSLSQQIDLKKVEN